MTVFEELVDELKIDNLIDQRAPDRRTAPRPAESADEAGTLIDAEQLAREKQRAEADFSSTQIVEHLFDSVEGDHVKSEAAQELARDARKAITEIRQLADACSETRIVRSRAALKQALNEWERELEHRDSRIDIARLRVFCENSQPPLSAKSLIALAGFYRNCKFSEQTAAKFEFVMTRLFTVDPDEVKRELRFGRGETIEQINTLYEKWSADPAEDMDRGEVTVVVERFAAFCARIDSAGSFADLLRSDLPATIREYKRSLGERILHPEILASVMDCNVRIGARFVEIAAFEKQTYGDDAVRAKYGDGFDEAATEAAVRTLNLAKLLESEDLKPEEQSVPIEIRADAGATTRSFTPVRRKGILGGVNKLLLAATMFTVIGGVAAFFLIEPDMFQQRAAIPVAKPANIGNTRFGKYFSDGRTTSSTFYLTAKPEWNGLTPEEKKQILRSAFEDAKKRGMTNVSIQDENNKPIAYASDTRSELMD